ncbi:hypothetical protein DSO57_1036739 [Entomophthora muscae]|uniref:Uncharacterized protein n=1 Tax=Entomophthora muscae TaxID=34485 RepID=A0ACC2UJW1_9FUNG|nr:hypothetical protein DSO57_1036739 [Entomophthora muscae]
MSQPKPSKNKSIKPEKSDPIELQLLQQIYSDYLTNRDQDKLETLPTILKVISSYQLLKWCFGDSDGTPVGDQKFGQLWCQKLKTLLIPPQGSDHDIYPTNIIIACRLISESVNQSQTAFICGVQDWALELLRCLSKQNIGPEVASHVIEVLSDLIMRTRDRPELQREITTNILPQFNMKLIELLDKNHEFCKIRIIEALRDSLKYFPKTFRNAVAKFKKVLLASWLSSDESKSFLLKSDDQFLLTHLVFECLALLTFTERSASAISEGFGQHFQALVATGHVILNELLASVQEESYREISQSYPIEAQDSYNVFSISNNLLLFRRFCLVCHGIVCCLNFQPQQSLGTPLSVPLNEIMNLLCRIYSVNPKSQPIESSQTRNLLSLISILPSLHAASHDVMIVLCRRVGTSGLMEKSKLLSDIVQKLLYFSKSHSETRKSVYCLVYHIADTLRDGLLYHSQDTLLASVLEELELKDQMSMAPKQFLAAGSSKKGKRAILTNSDALANGGSSLKPSRNYAVAMHILDLSLSSSYPIESEARLKLDMLLFRHSALSLSGELKLDSAQQFALSKALLSASLNASPSQAVLVEVAQAVFSSALLHPLSRMRHHSIDAIVRLNTLIRPQLPSIHSEKLVVSEQSISTSSVLVSAPSALPITIDSVPEPAPLIDSVHEPLTPEPAEELPVVPEGSIHEPSLKRELIEPVPESPRKKASIEVTVNTKAPSSVPMFTSSEKFIRAEVEDSDDEIPEII